MGTQRKLTQQVNLFLQVFLYEGIRFNSSRSIEEKTRPEFIIGTSQAALEINHYKHSTFNSSTLPNSESLVMFKAVRSNVDADIRCVSGH